MEVSPDEDRYLVFLSLVYRALEERQIVSTYWYRVTASARENAMLEHGDEAEIDGIPWRLTGKNIEANCLFLYPKMFLRAGEATFQIRPGDPVEGIKEEFAKWGDFSIEEDTEDKIDHRRLGRLYWNVAEGFFRYLITEGLLEQYLNEPEAVKAPFREYQEDFEIPEYPPTENQ